MYNVFRLTGRYTEAAYLRELFDEPTTVLYQVAALIRTIDEADRPGAEFDRETLVSQADTLIMSAIAALEGKEEADMVRHLLRVRDTLVQAEGAAQRNKDVEGVKAGALDAVNEYFRKAPDGGAGDPRLPRGPQSADDHPADATASSLGASNVARASPRPSISTSTSSPASTHFVATTLPSVTNSPARSGSPTCRGARREPRERLERVAEDVAAPTRADFPAVDQHAAAERGKVEAAPLGDRRAEDEAGVEEVVRDQGGRAERRIVAVPVVDDLDRRHHGPDGVRRRHPA